jgi:hypothetical protein
MESQGVDSLEMVDTTDSEKHRNRMDVVGRLEQKWLFIFEPPPQLNVNSHQPIS